MRKRDYEWPGKPDEEEQDPKPKKLHLHRRGWVAKTPPPRTPEQEAQLREELRDC